MRGPPQCVSHTTVVSSRPGCHWVRVPLLDPSYPSPTSTGNTVILHLSHQCEKCISGCLYQEKCVPHRLQVALHRPGVNTGTHSSPRQPMAVAAFLQAVPCDASNPARAWAISCRMTSSTSWLATSLWTKGEDNAMRPGPVFRKRVMPALLLWRFQPKFQPGAC